MLLGAGVVALFASVLQGAIGFGYGLVAVPLMLSVGFSLAQAVAVSTLSIGIQVLVSSLQLYPHIPWNDVKLAALIRYLTVPIGVLILVSVETLNTDVVRRVVGVALLVAISIRLLAQLRPIQRIPLPLSIGVFTLSGLLQGLVTMGGPPIVLWMTAKDFTAKQARAFTLSLFLLNAPVQILLLYLLSDSMNGEVLLIGLALSPLIIIGSTMGVRIGNRFSKPTLNIVAMAVLAIIALNAIV